MSDVDLDLIAAEWEAGLLPPERLPGVAVAMMEAGLDSPSLRLVAGLLPREETEAHELFAAALRELHVPRTRDEKERGVALAVEYAQRMLRGDVAPEPAARTIWDISISHFDNDTWREVGNLDAFVILSDEWHQLPDLRAKIEDDMREEAQRLLVALKAQ